MPSPPTAPEAAEDTEGLGALRRLAHSLAFELPVERFHFLRHGRTNGNATRTFQHPEEPLDQVGLDQARRAGELLAAARFSHIFASDMARAWRTAGAVSARTGLPVQAVPDLRERFFGEWIGTPSAHLDWREDPPGGETMQVFVERTVKGVKAALAGGPAPLIVAHGGNLQVICGLLGLVLPESHLANATPMALARQGQGWQVELLG